MAFLTKLKVSVTDYGRLLWDYKILFLTGAILFGTSILLPTISIWSRAPGFCQTYKLCTNEATPWGIFTSVFVYDGWQNIPAYFLILVTYSSVSDFVGPDERRKRARFSSAIIFVAAFIANALWLFVRPLSYSWGSSGVVYALWGVLLAFAFRDGMPKHLSWDIKTWYKNRKEMTSGINNLVIFTVTALVVVTQPSTFLSSAPGINVFAHAMSFLGGYFSAQAYGWIHRSKERAVQVPLSLRATSWP
jgi:hypothetical protein